MKPHRLRSLALQAPTHPGGRAHLSAASGLVVLGDRWYVVGDDTLHLAVFHVAPDGGDEPGRLVRLFAGELPGDAERRKACKPDLETLFRAPAFHDAPHGALVALASGSRANRHRAAWLPLDEGGIPSGTSFEASLEALYAPLHARFPDLNIEGAFVDRGELHLLQRANAGSPENAIVRYDWAGVAAWLGRGAEAPRPRAIDVMALGYMDGVPLGFTDGKPWGDGDGSWVFSAVAEATGDSYRDGACRGSVVGVVDGAGRLRRLEQLDGDWKVEGLDVAKAASGASQLMMVTDADDPHRPAEALMLPWD